MNQLTLTGGTFQDYLIQYPPSESSSEEIDISEMLDILSSIWIKQEIPREILYRSLLSFLETDFSSVNPYFKTKSGTYPMEIEEISEEKIITGMVNNDFIVKIPPISEYTRRVRVKSIEKAIPHIVEPEEI